MAILSSALNTLSELAILESNVEIPTETSSDICQEIVDELSQMPYLTEEEMRFDIDMIPIRASRRFGRYLIEMEDLSRFMMTNGISSVKDAIEYIMEAHNIQGQYHNIALVIDEDSILNEIESLGYNVTTDCWKATPKPGLGMPMIGKDHRDFKHFRDIANTKELMDLLTGRYGLPLIKKSYKQLGLLGTNDSNYDLQSDEYGGDFVAEETEDVKIKSKDGDTILQEKPPEKETQGGKKLQEATNPRQEYIQYLRDIAQGKYNDQDFM